MVERFSQPSAMVRLRHHPQVGDLAEPQAQSHRGIRQLLQHAGRLPLNASRHRAQRAHQNGPAGTAAQPQRGTYKVPIIICHSVLGAILTLKIFRVMETLVFGYGWVVGITPYSFRK